MKIVRTFHPVGQGAFYTERFGNVSVVYDCGSSTSRILLENQIEKVFKMGQQIDAVFISHLHDDHVNGLEKLVKYCDVRKVFLPLLTEEEKIVLLIQNEILFGYVSPFLLNLIDNQTIDGVATILISFNDEGTEGDISIESIPIDSDELINRKKIRNPKFSLYSDGILKWLFIPFNFKKNERYLLLKKYLYDVKLSIHSFDEFKDIWLNHSLRKKVIEIFRKIPQGLNSNSMTLYSGPEVFSKQFIHIRSELNSLVRFNHNIGCVYFGDYEAKNKHKWQEFVTYYNKYWNMVGMVQIPHHGSFRNFNKEINSKSPKFSIISAGKSNKFRHPNSSTLKSIIMEGGIPYIVNEDPKSKIEFVIYNS